MRRSLVLLIALAAACDSKATASDPQGGGARSELRSKEYESCSASAQCGDDLRCFDHMCRRTARSNVGDYYAALGAALVSRGDYENAIAAYTQAEGHYDSEKVSLPPDVDCAYGNALALAKKDKAELGARVLHRCILAVPVGSGLRDRALAMLATLSDSGLDPLAIGKDKPSDKYLTGAPSKPASDKLTVTVAGNPPPPAKSLQMITDKIEPELHSALVACWEAYTGATKKEALASTVSVKTAYIASEYADDPDVPGQFVVKVEVASGSSGPQKAADECVKSTVEPAIKGLGLRESFSTKLTITVK
jgi:hypothetical protein